MPLHEAKLYRKLSANRVRCHLCARHCEIPEGKTGFCVVRRNDGGTLYSLNYAQACAACVDPIAKKPLAHFHPGALVMSIASAGCNFRCRFCDNWMISQAAADSCTKSTLPPESVVEAARDNGCQGVSYTYTEPTVFFEYSYDTAETASGAGLFNTFVTNGYMTPEAVKTISPYLDAATVDFKGAADPQFYANICSVPSVTPIFESLIEMKRRDIHIEITNLIVPKIGESLDKLRALAVWISENLGEDVPFHLLRFHPNYKMSRERTTPIDALEQAYFAARKAGLNYVYIGNAPGHRFENTYCPDCGELLIKRFSFEIVKWNLTRSKRCPACSLNIPIEGELHSTGAAPPNSLF